MPPSDAGEDGPTDTTAPDTRAADTTAPGGAAPGGAVPGGGDRRVCEVVITAADVESLAGLTRALLDERLVACGHHIEVIRSIYRWEGAIEDEAEARVNLHTRLDLVPAIVERVKAGHPYDVPCVIALPVVAGNPDYLDWVVAETRNP